MSSSTSGNSEALLGASVALERLDPNTETHLWEVSSTATFVEAQFRARTLVNILSLSRIPLALAFVISFQNRLFFLSVALIVIAFVTDILDGRVARQLNVASIRGRLWDSLGDKALYTAVIIAFNSQGILSPILGWGLLYREVALYITRVLFIDNLPKIEQIRPLTNWHGYFMYILILLGLSSLYVDLRDIPLDLFYATQAAAVFALVFGIASIIRFQRLK
jgi:phosphatidylglycerophosphate synthase